MNDSNWCYFHSQLQERRTARHNLRGPDGRFSAPGQETTQPEVATETIDQGTYPVGAPKPTSETPETSAFDLSPIEDPASIQLALIDVAQALAANRIDTKRAGLLLYALQVASANTRHMKLSRFDAVRSVTYDDAGLPLASQRQGKDVGDINEEIRRLKSAR